jgi:predicted DNA-binding protein
MVFHPKTEETLKEFDDAWKEFVAKRTTWSSQGPPSEKVWVKHPLWPASSRQVYMYTRIQSPSMSTTIRVSKEDKEALEGLKRRLGTRTMSETLKKAIALAEASDDKFVGDLGALSDILSTARRSAKGQVRASERVDEEVAKAIAAESE